jgi:hypothetical protein
MTSPVFDDAARPPDETALAAELGPSKRHWDDVLAWLADTHPGLRFTWKHYGAKYGWQLKVEDRRRAVVYLIPRRGCFTAALALDVDAVRAVEASRLPAELVRAIVEAPAQREGRAARLDVTSRRHVQHVRALIAIKLRV